ncbi:MAG TPA: FHA domain-containing protein [Thermoanaerobaculia bacterium]|jgi:DNA-binding winged helix-turn-helix (wHTH) protein
MTPSVPTIYRFGQFVFDVGSRVLFYDGVERHLSPKGQHLLRLLLAARPNAVSRQELFDSLWPETFVVESNLASIVNEVRRALDDDPRNARFIRTVHAFGYAFGGVVSKEARGATSFATLLCENRSFVLPYGEHVLGRAQDVRIALTDPTVSRHHARLIVKDDGVQIEDLGSKNGTFVDGCRIAEPCPLNRQSRIVFGAVGASIVLCTFSSTESLKLDLSEVRRQVAELASSTP